MTGYDPHGYYMDTPQPIQNEITPHLLLKLVEPYYKGYGVRINHCFVLPEEAEDWSLELLIPSKGWISQFRSLTLSKLADMIQSEIDRFESQRKEQPLVQ